MGRIYQIIRSRIEYLVIIVLTTVLVAVVITLASPKEYEATARILVVQKQQNIDAFSASKSADYIASLLNEAIYSNSFVDSLLKSDPALSRQLPGDRTKRLKEWNKKVDSSVLSNKGILSLKVYDGNADTALHDASLIISTLTSEGANYYGGSTAIDLRVIDSPSVSSKPTRPSLPLNVVASLLVGLALDIVYVFFMDVRLSRSLEEREMFGRLHQESELPENISFLNDGHVAAAESEHVIAETFPKAEEATSKNRLYPSATQNTSAPENIPITPDPQEQIQNWMKKR